MAGGEILTSLMLQDEAAEGSAPFQLNQRSIRQCWGSSGSSDNGRGPLNVRLGGHRTRRLGGFDIAISSSLVIQKTQQHGCRKTLRQTRYPHLGSTGTSGIKV
jgi:hypothetical protein